MYELLLHPQGKCHPPSTCRMKDTAEWDPKDETCALSKSTFTQEVLKAGSPGVWSVKFF